jgi:hypothetical protein
VQSGCHTDILKDAVLSKGEFMKQSIIKIAIAAILAMIIIGCGAEPIKPVSGPEAAVAFGNISLPEGKISNVVLYKVGEGDAPPTKSPHRSHVFANGDFLIENVVPGKYFLREFTAGREKFDFNYRGIDEAEFVKGAAVEIKPGSVTYMGSYDVTGIDQKFKKSADFEIEHSKTAVRILILKHLKEESEGTGWDKRFERAMK